MGWLLLEVLLHVLLRGWMYRKLYPGGVPLHEKKQKEAAANVTAGIVKLVSLIHNAIQVCQTIQAGDSSSSSSKQHIASPPKAQACTNPLEVPADVELSLCCLT